jgi:hypothetical protein
MLPVDLPWFLEDLITLQAQNRAGRPCACAGEHGGSGRYVFLGPDGGHYRRSNYARRVFRPACDGRHEAANGRPAKVVIADTTAWPGVPVAAWPPAQPSTGADPASADLASSYAPPRGRGIQVIPENTPLACWLPIQPDLTAHGLRHSHKTWMAEDGIPEILAEQRLGHQVPGMRGLYAHASARMRDDLTAALQARWEESLSDRAAIDPHSPVPLLDELLAPRRGEINESADSAALRQRPHQPPAPGDMEKMISQIPPKSAAGPTQPTRMEPVLRASDLAKHQARLSGAKGTRTPDPLLANRRDRPSKAARAGRVAVRESPSCTAGDPG